MISLEPNKYQEWTWITFPNFIRHKVSVFLGNAFIDGFYLNGVVRRNYYFLPLLFLTGLLIGSFHLFFSSQEVYSASLTIISLMLILSCWSSAFGFWLWLGYSIGDLFFYHHSYYGNAFFFYIAKLIPLILLFILLISFPLISKMFRLQILSKTSFISRKGKYLHIIVYSLCYAITIFAWTQAVPTLLRPIYTWQRDTPTIEVVQPLQNHGWLIAILGLILGISRMMLEYKILNEGTIRVFQNSLIKSYQALPKKENKLSVGKWIKYFAWVVVYTFLMSGLLNSWIDFIIFPALLLVVFFLRNKLVTKPNFWTKTISKIPLALRFIISSGITTIVAYYIIKYFWDKGGNAFNPIYYSLLISLFVQFIFIPEIKRNEKS